MSAEIPNTQDAPQAPNWDHLDSLDLTEARRGIVETLKTRPWFQATDPELQKTVVSLPQKDRENHDGFLADLASRPDSLGGIRVEKLVDLPRGNFALIPKFQVTNETNGQVFNYEYVSWRYGPESGAKGIVYVRDEGGRTTHFIVLRGDKFATGQKEWDTVGGFIDKGVDGVQSVMDRIDKEIKEELGLPEVRVEEVKDLGNVNADAGMTNNSPGIFAAFISSKDAERISSEPVNPDVFELRSGALVIPLSQLPEIIMNNDDAYFQTAVARSIASGLINWNDVDKPVKPQLEPIEDQSVAGLGVAPSL